MYTHDYQILKAGIPAAQAKGALIMLHGRGASARSIIALSANLKVDGFAIYAPQASNNSWYPYSFMAKEEDNQPALGSALAIIKQLVEQVVAEGIQKENIYFLGFSQGACLTLEYVTRNAQRYGGVIAFTGGLIGESINAANYSGSFEGTPILLTTGDPDPHVPLTRVEKSLVILKEMGADLNSRVFKGRQHTVLTEELESANKLIFNK
jgi:phospholipase/carboxylesterase